MSTEPQVRAQALENAFQIFNEVSNRLAGSYRALQERVEELSAELAESRSERMRQLAEKERLAERLSKLLETLPAGVVLLDAEGRIRECNPVASDLLGDPPPGTPWEKVRNTKFSVSTASGGEIQLADGRLCLLTERPLEQAPGRILVLQDVTEARALQTRLERQDRLSAMGEMAAKLAHQIRTPLSSALLYVGHLGREDLTPAQRQRFSGRLRERLQHMERQVNDILAFSRGHTAQVGPLDLAALLEAVVAAAEPLAEAQSSRLRLAAVPAWVLGNPDALQGALANLVVNALHHGGPGVQVDLRLEVQGDHAALWVRDDGPGVPEDIREQIFDPFFTTRSDGTGLGLAVVQSVVLAHQGRLWLDTAVPGACFRLELPLSGRTA